VSEREEAFFALSLTVKNKKTVEQSLQSIVQGDVLEGDNAYHCDQCNKKVSAVKRMCLRRLPDFLILVLKRFEFDLDKMMKVKINDRCEFPFELDMLPYSQ
jgi:ubiquitin C-terminal hydrolase